MSQSRVHSLKLVVTRLLLLCVFALLFFLLPVKESEAQSDWNWYKGNLHTHTVNSDGDSAPDVVARWYKEHRYNFLVLTDHDFLTAPEGLNAVFGAPGKFLLMPGEEVSARYDKLPIHVNAFRIQATLLPVGGTSVLDTVQKNVDLIRKAGGVPSLNHPNFQWAVRPEDLKQVAGLKLFEVYNGHPTVNNAGGGGFESLDEMWDVVLTAGRETYGIAVDDAHHFKSLGPEFSNPGRGWVMVRARDLSTDSVLNALEGGEFYASTGVALAEMERLPDGIRLRIAEQPFIRFTTEFIGADGKVLARSYEMSSEYRLRPGDRYVRARVKDSNGNQAWAQPVFAR